MNEPVKLEDVIRYNREIKVFLTEVWGHVPKGRQKHLLKDLRIRSLLDRYKIPYEE